MVLYIHKLIDISFLFVDFDERQHVIVLLCGILRVRLERYRLGSHRPVRASQSFTTNLSQRLTHTLSDHNLYQRTRLYASKACYCATALRTIHTLPPSQRVAKVPRLLAVSRLYHSYFYHIHRKSLVLNHPYQLSV